MSLERLCAHLARHGIAVGTSTLSDWQYGHTRPRSAKSLRALGCLEEILGVPLVGLLEESDHLGERDSPLGDLLGDTDEAVEVLNQQEKVLVDARRRPSRIWSRTTVRARRNGVDRYLVRYFGNPGGTPDAVRLEARENCRLGEVRRHATEPVLVAELLFGHTLRAGETWVFELQITDGTGVPDDVQAHAFRHSEQQHLLEVRFHPSALPARCYSFSQNHLRDGRTRTGELPLSEHHTVHLLTMNGVTGVVGIGWDW
ncbi:hypothetical protein FKR81_38625 [Lentzea tibetensis]|uniref:Uncharacterized protein n=1 Tax=Lentzea tibetensis TaxID=2591470 RepID=A0A563EGX3_9PSEU|nr:hypothetical protein [Lentzea tibetensis]TWP45747.1 hypothetical protein FKR81_38625 [Lentzea tibetensis]